MKYRALVAMGLIAAIESYALYLGVDGTALSLSIGAIAGLGGYELAKKTEK